MEMDHRLVAAEARAPFRLWVRFDDGVEGEVDLSDIAGRAYGADLHETSQRRRRPEGPLPSS